MHEWPPAAAAARRRLRRRPAAALRPPCAVALQRRPQAALRRRPAAALRRLPTLTLPRHRVCQDLSSLTLLTCGTQRGVQEFDRVIKPFVAHAAHLRSRAPLTTRASSASPRCSSPARAFGAAHHARFLAPQRPSSNESQVRKGKISSNLFAFCLSLSTNIHYPIPASFETSSTCPHGLGVCGATKEGKGGDLPFRTFLNADSPCIRRKIFILLNI